MGDLYYRFDRFTPEQVFDWIDAGKTRPMQMDGYVLHGVCSNRIKTYHRGGCTCVACGLVGTHFYAETNVADKSLQDWYFHPQDYPFPNAHLNLYGSTPQGSEFMITSDHVVPKSLGGSNNVKNRVPLCSKCNGIKGNDPDWLLDLPRNNKGKLVRRPSRQLVPIRVKQEHVYV